MDKVPKARKTLGISRKLPNPSRLTFKDPSKAKNKPLSVKRTGVKKGLAGTAGGAALGGILGGPLGAIAGGGIGHIAEGAIGKGKDKKIKKMRKILKRDQVIHLLFQERIVIVSQGVLVMVIQYVTIIFISMF